MPELSVQLRLRPVRFGFLVRPDSMLHTLQVFRINTCLWGGRYNPIIPFINQVPRWWDRHGHRFETATQIINGYLDFFEPDFLVETEPGMANGLGFDKERVLSLADLLRPQGERHWDGSGLNVVELYWELYRKEFQFSRRHEHNIVHVLARDKRFTGLVACVFGSFPNDPQLAYIGRAFKDAIAPKEVALDSTTYEQLLKAGFTSALRLGHAETEVQYHDHEGPTIFVLDAFKARDLIDYWNLRTVRSQLTPIPRQWLPELSPYCKEFIAKNHRPLPGNLHGVMIKTKVLFSRSISTGDLELLHAANFIVDPPATNIRQDWYPSLWRPSPGFTAREMRATVTAAEKTLSSAYESDSPRITFETLHPDFAEEHSNRNRWANVVRLRDWTRDGLIATTYPTDYRDPKVPRFSLGSETVLPTTEGFVTFPRIMSLPEHFQLADGTSAFRDWFEANGLTATLSEAGRATQQIINTVGSFGLRSLANAQVIELLNSLSRRPLSPSAHYLELKNKIRDATKNDIWGGRTFESLVEHNVLELGLELKCSKCASWNWYSLKQLDYEMRCTLCLQHFDFPVLNPGSSDYARWAYRLIGPFVLPDYAGGGYASSLAIRFFKEVLGSSDNAGTTWSTGQNLELAPKRRVEADFILWYQRKLMFGNDYPTDLVFGEAKSFGKDTFKAEDIKRMKALAEHFPGSICVFATMKPANSLSAEEVERLSKLALWGREFLKDKSRTRAPLVILTGTELFTSFSFHEAWEKAGGQHAAFAKAGMFRPENLRNLADATQQLYLGLPSYHAWLELKWRKRRERHARKRAPGEAAAFPVEASPPRPNG